jgi:hypothetical protein
MSDFGVTSRPARSCFMASGGGGGAAGGRAESPARSAAPPPPPPRVKYDIVATPRARMLRGLWQRKCVLCVDERQASLVFCKLDGYGALQPPARLIPVAQVERCWADEGLGSCGFNIRVWAYSSDLALQRKASHHTFWFSAPTPLQAAEWVLAIQAVADKHRVVAAPARSEEASAAMFRVETGSSLTKPLGSPSSPLQPTLRQPQQQPQQQQLQKMQQQQQQQQQHRQAPEAAATLTSPVLHTTAPRCSVFGTVAPFLPPPPPKKPAHFAPGVYNPQPSMLVMRAQQGQLALGEKSARLPSGEFIVAEDAFVPGVSRRRQSEYDEPSLSKTQGAPLEQPIPMAREPRKGRAAPPPPIRKASLAPRVAAGGLSEQTRHSRRSHSAGSAADLLDAPEPSSAGSSPDCAPPRHRSPLPRPPQRTSSVHRAPAPLPRQPAPPQKQQQQQQRPAEQYHVREQRETLPAKPLVPPRPRLPAPFTSEPPQATQDTGARHASAATSRPQIPPRPGNLAARGSSP